MNALKFQLEVCFIAFSLLNVLLPSDLQVIKMCDLLAKGGYQRFDAIVENLFNCLFDELDFGIYHLHANKKGARLAKSKLVKS